MKKLLIIALLTNFIWACDIPAHGQSGFTINGTITGYESGMVFLKKRDSGNWVTLDSMESNKGKFNFKGKMDTPEIYYITFGNNKKISRIFLDNSNITFSVNMDDLRNPVIKGSKAQDQYNQYRDEIKSFDDKLKDLYQQYMAAQKEGNKELLKQIDSTYYAINDEKTGFIKNYISSNNKSAITPYVFLSGLSYTLEVNEMDSIFKLLDESLASSPYYEIMGEKIKVLRNVEIGKKAPDFTLNDTLGNPISLSSFKGKYLLIDFWAAWCGPCRAENPNNVKLYADYKDKGFEIFGVSFDNGSKAWVKAINKDGLTWPQVSDLKGWSSAAGKLYGVSAIPHTLLLDKDGVILAKNLRGEKLREKVAELLD
ncbi:MAG: TlpA disulfide reductase family protein [Bacteroidota bacterium]